MHEAIQTVLGRMETHVGTLVASWPSSDTPLSEGLERMAQVVADLQQDLTTLADLRHKAAALYELSAAAHHLAGAVDMVLKRFP